MSLNVQQNFGDGGGGETNVSKGQIEEEDIQGPVEVGVWADDQDDEQIPSEGD